MRLPGSKSLTNRALVLAALSRGDTTLTGVLFADDTRVMLDALEALGFDLTVEPSSCRVIVHGAGGRIPSRHADLHLGNSGTTTRFLTAALTLGHGEYRVDGIARMRERPIGQLVEPLMRLGAEVNYENQEGFPPLRVHGSGPLDGGALTLQPTLSSQFVSALLMAGACFKQGLDVLFEGEIISLPYVQMTLKLMQHFGVNAKLERGATGDPVIRVPCGGYVAQDYYVEPDASNASYFLAAAAVVPGSSCAIENLGSSSLQGDAMFCDLLGRMGCHVEQQLHKNHGLGSDERRSAGD